MAEALISGLIRSGGRTVDEIMVTNRREERAQELAGKYGVTATLDNGEAVRWADVLVLMAKPVAWSQWLVQVPILSSLPTIWGRCSLWFNLSLALAEGEIVYFDRDLVVVDMARELGLDYAGLGVISNWGAGLRGGHLAADAFSASLTNPVVAG